MGSMMPGNRKCTTFLINAVSRHIDDMLDDRDHANSDSLMTC